MKKMTSFLLAATLLFSCKQKDKHLDPNKQVDEGAVKGETYVSQDMGWTIVIPKGWTVISRDQTEANEKKGARNACAEMNGGRPKRAHRAQAGATTPISHASGPCRAAREGAFRASQSASHVPTAQATA